jgi:hypothetical protein
MPRSIEATFGFLAMASAGTAPGVVEFDDHPSHRTRTRDRCDVYAGEPRIVGSAVASH